VRSFAFRRGVDSPLQEYLPTFISCNKKITNHEGSLNPAKPDALLATKFHSNPPQSSYIQAVRYQSAQLPERFQNL
jgi:hypothetical protein